MKIQNIVLAVVVVLVVGKILFFYHGLYFPAELNREPFVLERKGAEIRTFEENVSVYDGTVAIDLSHNNTITEDELQVLVTKLIARGVDVVFLDEFNLDSATAVVIPVPKIKFGSEEIEDLKLFYEHGGRILLLADPDRPSKINSVGVHFGTVFSDDYLYNMQNNDANFKYVIYSIFANHSLTENLGEVSLYTACSVNGGFGVVVGDDATVSSEALGKNPIVLKDHVLAICDTTFLRVPYYTYLDNEVLISNIAVFLADSSREYSLSEFPGMFSDVEIVSEFSEPALEMRKVISGTITDCIHKGMDAIVLGGFSVTGKIPYCEGEGTLDAVTVGSNVFVSGLSLGLDSTIIHLEDADSTILFILSGSEAGILDGVKSFLNGTVSYITDKTAVVG